MINKYLKKIASALSAAIFFTTIVLPGNLFAQTKENYDLLSYTAPKGWKKEMEVIGVGYRANATGQQLELALGFSHAIILEIPNEVKVTTTTEKGKAPVVSLESFDKQLLGQVAAKIRSFRKPEPYKGKGIRFVGEEIRRKAGKSAGKK